MLAAFSEDDLPYVAWPWSWSCCRLSRCCTTLTIEFRLFLSTITLFWFFTLVNHSWIVGDRNWDSYVDHFINPPLVCRTGLTTFNSLHVTDQYSNGLWRQYWRKDIEMIAQVAWLTKKKCDCNIKVPSLAEKIWLGEVQRWPSFCPNYFLRKCPSKSKKCPRYYGANCNKEGWLSSNFLCIYL